MTTHPLPAGGIDTESHQTASDHHDNPGRGDPHHRAEGTEPRDGCDDDGGPEGARGSLALRHQPRARVLRGAAAPRRPPWPRPPLVLPPRVGIGAITS